MHGVRNSVACLRQCSRRDTVVRCADPCRWVELVPIYTHVFDEEQRSPGISAAYTSSVQYERIAVQLSLTTHATMRLLYDIAADICNPYGNIERTAATSLLLTQFTVKRKSWTCWGQAHGFGSVQVWLGLVLINQNAAK